MFDDRVLVDWRKWPDTAYRQTVMVRLGEDDHGTWLFAARGTATSYAGHDPAPLPVDFLTLVPSGPASWIATWMSGNDEIDIDLYVDIVLPARWSTRDHLEVVDLDLDVIRRRNGEVILDDEDELELHATTLGYPSHVVATARATAAEVLGAVRDGRTPFGRPPDRWLTAARS